MAIKNLCHLRYELEKTQIAGFPEMIKALIARKMKYDRPTAGDGELRTEAQGVYSAILRDAIDFCNSDMGQGKKVKRLRPDVTSCSLKDYLRA